MHPYKYDFRKVDKVLKESFIENHNTTYDKLIILKGQIESGNSMHKVEIINFLGLYFENFSKLSNGSILDQTIFCCNLKFVQKLSDDHDVFDSLKEFKLKLDNDQYVDTTKEDKDGSSIFNIVEKVLNYDGKRQLFYRFLLKHEINVCSYCLNQYAIIYESEDQKEWKLSAQLDHLRPKSDYPLVSLSINNLFPVCGHCNNRKGSSPIDYNPLDESYKYNWNFDECFKIKRGRVTFDSLKQLEIKSPKIIDSKQDLAIRLDYRSLYNHFDDYAKSFVERMNNFGSKGYGENVVRIFKTENITAEEKLKEFLSDQSIDEKNIFKYPLTKFKLELYRSVKEKSKK